MCKHPRTGGTNNDRIGTNLLPKTMTDCLLLHPQTGYEYDSYNEYVINIISL